MKQSLSFCSKQSLSFCLKIVLTCRLNNLVLSPIYSFYRYDSIISFLLDPVQLVHSFRSAVQRTEYTIPSKS